MANGMWCLSIRRKEKKTMFRAIFLRMLLEREKNFLLCLIDNDENTVILIIMPSIFFTQKQCHRKIQLFLFPLPHLMFPEHLTKSNWTHFQYQPYSHIKLNKFARYRLPSGEKKGKQRKIFHAHAVASPMSFFALPFFGWWISNRRHQYLHFVNGFRTHCVVWICKIIEWNEHSKFSFSIRKGSMEI